ncbi:MAG: sensor histidine kinase [Suipraeoptans sp.]
MLRKIKRIKTWTLQKQTFIFYGVLLGISLLAILFVVVNIMQGTVEEKADTVLKRDGMRIQTNFESLINRADEYSKIIMFSAGTQSLLSESKTVVSRTNMDSIYAVIGSTFINSVYIYDFNGNEYTVFSDDFRQSKFKDVKQAPWYQQVADNNGGYNLIPQSGGFLDNESHQSKYLSFVRVINDLDTQKPIGVLIMNVTEADVQATYVQVIEQYGILFDIKNEDDDCLLSSEDNEQDSSTWSAPQINAPADEIVTIKHQNQSYHCMNINLTNGWIGTLSLNYKAVEHEYTGLIGVFAAIFVLAVIVIVLGSMYIANMINAPIKQMLLSMSKFDEQPLEPIACIETNKELNELQKGYNLMVDEIQRLFKETVAEQKRKRKYELEVLQTQIRPHFLYNTFDAIGALALMNRSDDIFIVMQALGKYYRNSLHKGQEIIPLADELKIVENYLIILKYRFDSIFEAKYDIDDSVLQAPILKLTLQPFVENAIFHGMKPRKQGGVIEFKAKDVDGRIIIQIIDNGVGMSNERIDQVLYGKVKSEGRGFGVHSTIERLHLHYDVEDIFDIKSEENKGTIITLRIPKQEWRQADHDESTGS